MAGLYSSGTTQALGAQGTICGGGRYDGLVEHLGGRATPGVGFALGIERVVLLMESLDDSRCLSNPSRCIFNATTNRV